MVSIDVTTANVGSGLEADVINIGVRIDSSPVDTGSAGETIEVGRITGGNIGSTADDSAEVVSVFPLVTGLSSVTEVEGIFVLVVVLVVSEDHGCELPGSFPGMVVVAEDDISGRD